MQSAVTDIKTEVANPHVNNSVEQRASSMCHINMGERRSYDINFKLRVIREVTQTNNLQAAEQFGVSECNVQCLSLIHISF